jgi:nucleoside-diphosphate-sugar epimerase
LPPLIRANVLCGFRDGLCDALRAGHQTININIDPEKSAALIAKAKRVRKMVFTSSTAVFGIPAQLPIRRRREFKTHWLPKRASVRCKVMFCTAVAFGFPVKVAVFNVHPHRQAHVVFAG